MGGKSKAPPAPDYAAQARATSQGNLDVARAQTSANRINQVTPYGSIKYTNQGNFNQPAYHNAVQKYDAEWKNWMAHGSPQGLEPVRPDQNNFYDGDRDAWSSEIQLSETGQQLLDADSRTRLRLAGLQDTAADRVAGMLGNTDLNESTGMDGWDKYSNLLMDRLNPDLDRQQAALDTKLANQGVTQGSEAWGAGQTQFGKQRADANVAAQLAGANLQNQFFQQQAYLRNLPINELNALRSGSAVTNPTFSTPGQQGQTSGPDLMGASQEQYGSAVGQVNARNAQSASNTQAGVGLAAAALMFY